MKIYLCGGMHSNWRDKVIKALPQYEFLDPCTSGLTTEADYTAWDLSAIREADFILAFMDRANPSGFGLNFEIGFAHALGKPIYLVIEPLGNRDKYFGMVRTCSRRFGSLVDAVVAFQGEAKNAGLY